MKKFTAAALTAAMGISLLAGCGAASEETVPVQSVSMICGYGAAGVVDRFAGVVTARSQAEIEKDAERTVKEILVEEGESVEEGQALFSYDGEELQLDLDKAKLELEQLKNSVTTKTEQKAKLEKEKASAASDQQLSYSLEIQELEADIQEANYNSAVKEKEITKLQDTLSNLEVTSPVSGVVMTINETGATDDYGNEKPFMTISETGAYRVKG